MYLAPFLARLVSTVHRASGHMVQALRPCPVPHRSCTVGKSNPFRSTTRTVPVLLVCDLPDQTATPASSRG